MRSLDKVFAIKFSSVYPHYIQKVEKKGRTIDELHKVICWLTGYDEQSLKDQIDAQNDLKTFFEQAPKIHPNASKIKGSICGHKVEEIENPLMQKIRYMDKLVDELAKGKSMDKILRQ